MRRSSRSAQRSATRLPANASEGPRNREAWNALHERKTGNAKLADPRADPLRRSCRKPQQIRNNATSVLIFVSAGDETNGASLWLRESLAGMQRVPGSGDGPGDAGPAGWRPSG